MNRSLIFFLIFSFIATEVEAQKSKFEWVSTTSTKAFNQEKQLMPEVGNSLYDVEILVNNAQQTIDGFGGCFNELGWNSLKALRESDRQNIMKELFESGVGANFTI